MNLRRTVLGLLALPLALSMAHSPVHAQSESWTNALSASAGDKLSLSWRQGLGGGDTTQLRISEGTAQAERCSPDCTPLGKPLPLTSGQKEQILSGLRSAGLESLRSTEEAEMTADRELSLLLPGQKPLRIARPRMDWPGSQDGQGIATTLDELLRSLVQKSAQRAQLSLPQSLEELAELRLMLSVSTSKQPGGQLTIEHQTLTITPEEGSLPRTPRPRPSSRLLTAAEQAQLVKALQGLDFDRLEAAIPQRARPAVGDDDGRLLQLHVLAASAVPSPAAKVAQRGGAVAQSPVAKPAAAPPKQPRGLRRYVADWVRSPAGPAVRLLGSWLQLNLPTPPSPAAEK